jgi:uncharacterized protein YkwD
MDAGPKGIVGHNGTNTTMSSRIEAEGSWKGTIGENISYGMRCGEDVVI